MTQVDQLVFVLDDMFKLVFDVAEIEINLFRLTIDTVTPKLTRQLLKSVQCLNDAKPIDKLLAAVRNSSPASTLSPL